MSLSEGQLFVLESRLISIDVIEMRKFCQPAFQLTLRQAHWGKGNVNQGKTVIAQTMCEGKEQYS